MKSQVLNNLFELNIDEENDKNELLHMLEAIKNSKYYSVFKQVLSDVDEELFIKDPVHGISHNERVAILATYLAIQEDISIEDYRILLIASLYHDIGRKIAEGREHGRQSANIIKDKKADIIPDFDDLSTRKVQFLCTIHSNPDDLYSEILKEYELEDSNSIKMLTNIIKDADALDRVRLRRFGRLDVTQIRNESSRQSVPLAKMLLREYKDIEYELGGSANLSVFDMNSDELLEDEDNYYLIRGLNITNIEDIDNPEIEVIRTKARVLYEDSEKSRFYGNKAPTIDEVFSNVRTARYGKETQCTSFTSNASVAMDYDGDNNNRFVMLPIPKTGIGDEKTFNAGRFLLQEINKKVASTLRYGRVDDDIKDLISQIESETTLDGISTLMDEAIDKLTIRKEHKRYTNIGEKLNKRITISTRINHKRVLNSEQELEYMKTVAKLTVLELTGYIPRVIPSQKNNAQLLTALGSAFSSNEYFYYGDIPKANLIKPSKEEVELLSLLQQSVARKTLSKEDEETLERKIISQIRNGNRIIEPISRTREKEISIPTSEAIPLLYSQNNNTIIPYYKGSLAINYAINYSRAKIRTRKLLESLKKSFESDPNYEEYSRIIDSMIEDESIIVVNPSLISRKDGRGITLFGAVNLDMNVRTSKSIIFSIEEHERFINELNSLTPEELERVSNGELDFLAERGLFTKTLDQSTQLTAINDYYVDYIIDNLIYNHRFEENTIRTERDSDLRKRLRTELSKHDIEKLFNAFLVAGVEQDEIPNLIINLLLENGYADKESFDELISSNNLIEFINENLINFNRHLSMYSLERFLQITDSSYHVENTNLNLREYQALAKDNLDEIYKTHKLAGVVLPTGAGKSFVTMAELLEYKNKEIVYFAPQEAILYQMQQHILKHILNKKIIETKNVDNMLSMSISERKDFLKDKVFNRGIDIEKTLLRLKNATTEEEKEEIRRLFLPRRTANVDDVMDAINTAEGFPHLKMYCYQSLNSSQFEELQKKKIDFMVLDEVHRVGADTWGSKLDRIIETHSGSKILGITATPVRNTPINSSKEDNSSDVMQYMARKYGNYTEDEIDGKEYLASEMYLVDAIKNRYVVEPKIVPFKYTLALTSEYEYVKNAYSQARKAEPNSELTKSLKQSLDRMNEIIGETPFTKDKVVKKSAVEKIAKVIEQNFPEHFKNGKMIVFLEQAPSNYGKTTEEYVLEQIDLIQQYFEGINPNIKSRYLLSNRKNKKENEIAISEFESIDSDELKLLFAINMLNEGVHVENVNGELMLRRIGDSSNILYFQQIGRVIYSIDPEHPVKDEDRPIIFDFYNNYLTRDFDKVVNRTTETSDLQLMMIIYNWINKNNGEFPDIDSSNFDEVRKAINLKRIQKKYDKYKEVETEEDVLKINSNLSRSEVIEVLKILEISRDLELFDRILPNRTLPPPEEEIGDIKMIDITGEVKDFLDVFKKAKKEVSKNKARIVSSNKIRLKSVVDILQTISDYGFDITDKNFINQYMKAYQIKDSLSQEQAQAQARENLSLYDLLEVGFDENIKQEIMHYLDMDEDELKQYKIYDEFCYARSMLSQKNRATRNLFNAYDLMLIRKLGFFVEFEKPISIVENGFIEKGPSAYEHKNIYTGTDFNEDGYDYEGFDIDGFDEEGYDREGYDLLKFKRYARYNKYDFSRDGYHYITGTKYNNEGFDFNRIHKDTMDYYNPHGFDIEHNHRETHNKISPRFFDFDGKYYELVKDDFGEKYVFTGLYYDKTGRDIDGWDVFGVDEQGIGHFDIPIDDRGFNPKKLNIHTSTIVDEHGLNYDGKFCYMEKNEWVVTDLEYGTDGYNKDGFNERNFDRQGINTKTNTFLDENGFDVNEIYWKKDENGVYICTNSKYDENGRNCYGIDKYDFSENGTAYERIQRKNGTWIYETRKNKVNKYGFDYSLKCNGKDYNRDGFNADKIYVKTGELVDERHFNIDHYYCVKDENGNWVSTGKYVDERGFDYERFYNGRYGSYLDPEGYDCYGFDIHHFNRNHMFVDEDGNESIVNEYGFGYDEYLYEKDENGVYVKTDKKRDKDGFDIDGFDECFFDREHLYDGRSEFNPDGFNYLHIHRDTGTNLDTHEFDYHRIHFKTKDVVDERHFNIEGFFCKKDKNGQWKSTGKRLDEKHFDIDGNYYGKKGYKYNDQGYDCHGIDVNGFNENHMYVDKDGNESVVNEFGFGYDMYIYEKDENGTYVKTDKKVDKEGFNFFGFDKYHFERNHLYRGKDQYNPDGFDYNHLHKDTNEKFDIHGFNIDRIHRKTGKEYDERFFDIDGYFYKKGSDGEYYKTKSKLNDRDFTIDGKYKDTEYTTNPEGYDIDNVFHPELIRNKKAQKDYYEQILYKNFDAKFKDGKCITTNLPYDEFYFKQNKRNAITGLGVDLRGFDCFGQCHANKNLRFDQNGFGIDGRHKDTGEFYYKGYNCYGVDEEGKDKSGKEPIEIQRIKEFLDAESIEKMKSVVGKYNSDVRKRRGVVSYNNIPKILFFKAGEMYPPFKDELKKRLKELMDRKIELDNELLNPINIFSKSAAELKQMRAELTVLEAKINAISIDGQGEK